MWEEALKIIESLLIKKVELEEMNFDVSAWVITAEDYRIIKAGLGRLCIISDFERKDLLYGLPIYIGEITRPLLKP